MRRRGLGGVAAALIVGLGAAVAMTRGAEYDGNVPVAKGLLSGLFHEKPRGHAKQQKKSIEDKSPPAASVESAAAEQQRHMNALIRRMEVCDRLRMVANQTGNEALMNRANELEERANAIYRQQTAGLPLPAQTPLSVLAGDGQNPGRGREGAMPSPLPDLRSSDRTRLGGSMDQREQAVLNGTSMGGN